MSHNAWTCRQPGLHVAVLSRVQLALREGDECAFYYALSTCASDYARPIVEARHRTLFSLTTQKTAWQLVSLVFANRQAAIRCARNLLSWRNDLIDNFRLVMEFLSDEHYDSRDGIANMLVWSEVWDRAPRCAALMVAHPGLDITARCYKKRTMLMYALWFKNNAAISALLNRKHNDLSATCWNGHDTLWYALESRGAYVPYEDQRWYGLERIAPMVDDRSVLAAYRRITRHLTTVYTLSSSVYSTYYGSDTRLRAEIETRCRWNALQGHRRSAESPNASRGDVVRLLVIASARGYGVATLSP